VGEATEGVGDSNNILLVMVSSTAVVETTAFVLVVGFFLDA